MLYNYRASDKARLALIKYLKHPSQYCIAFNILGLNFKQSNRSIPTLCITTAHALTSHSFGFFYGGITL